LLYYKNLAYFTEIPQIHTKRRGAKILSGYDLPMEDLHTSSLEYFWVAEDKNQVIGVCGIDYSNHVGLVRSLAVDKQAQRKGSGRSSMKLLKVMPGIEEYCGFIC
jgi:hypothetical protein